MEANLLGPIKLAYVSTGAGHAPMWVAAEESIFSKHGLEADLLMISGHGAVRALLEGEIQFLSNASHALAQAGPRAEELVFLAGALNRLVQYLVTAPAIREPQQLAGKRVVIGGRGDIQEWLLEYLLEQWGVDKETVALIPEPDIDSRIRMLADGQADASLLSVPSAYQAEKLGLRLLTDLSKLPDFQLDGLIALREYVARHEGIAKRVVSAYCDAIRLFKEDPPLAKRVVAKYTGVQEEDILQATHRRLADLFPQVPRPSVEGIGAMLRLAASRGVLPVLEDVAGFVDARFVTE